MPNLRNNRIFSERAIGWPGTLTKQTSGNHRFH